MNRRDALYTMTGLVAGTALLALPAGKALAQMPPAGAAKLTMAQYKAMTLLGGTFAKQSSQLALSQASSPKVREFAQFEVDEQIVVAQVLTNTNKPPPVPLDQTHASMLQNLQGQSGHAFDMLYVRGQIAGHQELLTVQQGYLNAMPADMDMMHAAMFARMTIMMHLTMLHDLMATLPA